MFPLSSLGDGPHVHFILLPRSSQAQHFVTCGVASTAGHLGVNSPSLQFHSSFPWATLQNERLARKHLCQALVLGRARLSASRDRAPGSPYQWTGCLRMSSNAQSLRK